jgi:beta-galactosidase
MLVMDEAFDMWSVGKTDADYSRYFPEWWERDTAAMVNKDYNHPSVVLYSIGNEIPDTGSRIGSQWGRKIAEKIASLDRSRFIINSINGMVSVMDQLAARRAEEDKNTEINSAMADAGAMMKRLMDTELVSNATEESYSCVDIAGYNYMDSRYEADKARYPNRIICGSETFPRDIASNWALVEANSHIIGDFTWTGWDYLGEAGIGKIDYSGKKGRFFYGEYPWHIAYCGDIDITGGRRPASYYREIVWGLRKEPYIAVERPDRYGAAASPSPWSWSDTIDSWTWPGFEGKPVKLEVYSAADEVELLLNGNSLGRAAAGKKAEYKAVFDTVYRPGVLEAAAYSGGRETGRTRIVSAAPASGLRLDCGRPVITADTGDLAYITISVVDSAGVLNTYDEKMVSLSVRGAGCLQGFGSADPESVEDYFSPARTTFYGRALAVIRSGGRAGEILVTAEAAGCPAQTITIKVE